MPTRRPVATLCVLPRIGWRPNRPRTKSLNMITRKWSTRLPSLWNHTSSPTFSRSLFRHLSIPSSRSSTCLPGLAGSDWPCKPMEANAYFHQNGINFLRKPIWLTLVKCPLATLPRKPLKVLFQKVSIYSVQDSHANLSLLLVWQRKTAWDGQRGLRIKRRAHCFLMLQKFSSVTVLKLFFLKM